MNRLGVINEKHRLSHQDARAAFDKHGHAQIFLHHPRLVMKQNRFPVPLPAQKNMTIDLTNEDTVMTNEDTVIFDLTKDDEETNDDNQEPIIYQTCLQRVVKLEKAFGIFAGHINNKGRLTSLRDRIAALEKRAGTHNLEQSPPSMHLFN